MTVTENDIISNASAIAAIVNGANPKEIQDLTEKTSFADNDIVIINDSADSFNAKKVKKSNLGISGGGGWSKTYPAGGFDLPATNYAPLDTYEGINQDIQGHLFDKTTEEFIEAQDSFTNDPSDITNINFLFNCKAHNLEAWQASTVYSSGQVVSGTSGEGILFECTTPGTSGGTEPTWNTGEGNTTNDNGIVWTAKYFHVNIKVYHASSGDDEGSDSAFSSFSTGDIVVNDLPTKQFFKLETKTLSALSWSANDFLKFKFSRIAVVSGNNWVDDLFISLVKVYGS